MSLSMACDSTIVGSWERGCPGAKAGDDRWLGPKPLGRRYRQRGYMRGSEAGRDEVDFDYFSASSRVVLEKCGPVGEKPFAD